MPASKGLGLSHNILKLWHLMKCTHLNYGVIKRKHSPELLKCLILWCPGSFLQIIFMRTSKNDTQDLLWRYMQAHISSGWERVCKFVHKTPQRSLQTPVLPQATKIKAADLRRLYVCVRTMSQMEIKKSPCSTDLCNCLSLVTFHAFSFTFTISQKSCQILSKETRTSLAVSYRKYISISEMAGTEHSTSARNYCCTTEFYKTQ